MLFQRFGGSKITTDKKNKKILFLVRKNPDGIGGIQSHSGRLIDNLSESFQVEKVVWRGPEWLFPIYYWRFYRKAIKSNADLIHCDDAVTAIIGAKIKKQIYSSESLHHNKIDGKGVT